MWFQYIQDNSKAKRKIMLHGGHRDESSEEVHIDSVLIGQANIIHSW